MSEVKPWRRFVSELTAAQRDHMLNLLLSRQIDEFKSDGDVAFREADPHEPNSKTDIYWTSCGESVIPPDSVRSPKNLLMNDRKPPPSFSPVYAAALYPELAVVFREHGYALAVHGSLRRDMDLVAVPWVEEPSHPDVVVDEITTTWWIRKIGDIATKEHQRRVYTISIGHGECAIDLSFMPTFPAAAFSGIREHLANISPDERAEIIPRILDGYCQICGDVIHSRTCNCQRDE